MSCCASRVVACCRATTGLPCLGTGVPWVYLRGPTCVSQSPGRLCGKAPTVVTSCVPCARVRTSRSCPTENTYTPARLEALFELSVVTILSISCHFTKFSAGCGCSFQLVILLKISSNIFSCLLSAVSQSILFTQMQICFLSLSNAVASVLGFHRDLRDVTHAALRVRGVVSIFNCSQCAKFQKELVVRLIIDNVR